MKFIVTSDNLCAGLRRVMNTIASKPVTPVLANVLLEAKDGQLTITGSDNEMRISTAIVAMVMDDGAITLQAKKFNEIVGALPTGDVTIESAEDEAVTVLLSCQKSKFRIHGLDAAEYPEMEPFAEEWGFSIGGKELVDSLVRVCYARSDDENRKSLNGVMLSIRSGIRTFAASDGRRLALVENNLESGSDEGGGGAAAGTGDRDGEIILPYKAVCELIRSVDQSKAVVIHLTQSMVVFENYVTTIRTKLVSGAYPNYRSVIPMNFAKDVVIPRALFLDVLKRISMVSSNVDGSSSVNLDISNGQIQLSASSSEYGEGSETIDAIYDGEPLKICFNPQFLQDPLKALSCDQFKMRLNDNNTPVELTGDAGFIYILMPMHL